MFLEPCENPRMPCPHISWDIFHLAGSLPETALVAPDQSSAWPTRCQSSGFSPAKSFVDVLVGTAPPRMMILPLFTGLKNHPRWFGLGNSFLSTVSCPFSTKMTYFEGEFSSHSQVSAISLKLPFTNGSAHFAPTLGKSLAKAPTTCFSAGGWEQMIWY